MGDRYKPRYDSWRPSNDRPRHTRQDESHRAHAQPRYYSDRHGRRHDMYYRDRRPSPTRRGAATTTPTLARRSSIDCTFIDNQSTSSTYETNDTSAGTYERRNQSLGFASANAPITSTNGYTYHQPPSSNGHPGNDHDTGNTYTTSSAPSARPTNVDPNRVMPKHFAKPLTCFYWATQGCQKTAEECWYCHYHTGIIAAAPVRLGGDTIAGTAASLRAQEMSQDDELLRARMRVVNAKEESINEHEKRVRAEAEGLRRVVGQVYDALHHLDSAQGEARHSLQEQREDLTDTFLRSQEEEPMVTTLQTLDNTLASLSTFKGRISSVAHHLKITIGVVEFNSRVGVEIEKGSTALGAQEMAGDPASGAVTQDGDHADDRGLDGLLMDDVAVDGGAPDGALVGGEDQCGSYEVKRALDEDCHSKTG